MFRPSYASLILGWMIALLLSQQANAATYNFYFPKKGGPPKVERSVDVGQFDEDDAPIVVADDDRDDDDEPVYVEEVIPPPPLLKKRPRAYLPPVAVPYCASGTVVIPPVVIQSRRTKKVLAPRPTPKIDYEVEEEEAEFDEATYVVPPGTDLLSGSNTTPGHRLRPRTTVVRRTVVIDR